MLKDQLDKEELAYEEELKNQMFSVKQELHANRFDMKDEDEEEEGKIISPLFRRGNGGVG